MNNKTVRAVRFVIGSLFALTALGATGTAIAQAVPHSFVASPDIYKVIAEDEQYRVIEVAWQPGQRDQFHSHPASGVYYLTDCKQRSYRPDGTIGGEFDRKAGFAIVQKPIPSHSVENIGQSVCKLIMFEPK
jgi:hypothetical protein